MRVTRSVCSSASDCFSVWVLGAGLKYFVSRSKGSKGVTTVDSSFHGHPSNEMYRRMLLIHRDLWSVRVTSRKLAARANLCAKSLEKLPVPFSAREAFVSLISQLNRDCGRFHQSKRCKMERQPGSTSGN